MTGEPRGPYWLKQWAADSSQRSPTTVAPQKCREPSFRLTCQGTSPDAAPNPPTIRVGFSSAGLAPHSAGMRQEGPRISARSAGGGTTLLPEGPRDTGHSLRALAGPGHNHPVTHMKKWRLKGALRSQASTSTRPSWGDMGEKGEDKITAALFPPVSAQQTQATARGGSGQRQSRVVTGLGAGWVQVTLNEAELNNYTPIKIIFKK